jgi:hypothetical protein
LNFSLFERKNNRLFHLQLLRLYGILLLASMEEPNTAEIVDKAISTSVAEEPNVNLENSAQSGDGEDACLPGNDEQC